MSAPESAATSPANSLEKDAAGKTPQPHYQVAWTAYIAPTFKLLLFLFISLIVASQSRIWVGVVLALFFTGRYVLAILYRRSLRLYADSEGVWVFSGIFPWNSGVGGVKWRDLDEAVFYQGFISWLCKSYDVRISHRFTKSGEIILDSIARGDEAVMHINALHKVFLEQHSA